MRPVARYPPPQSNLANPFAHLSQQQSQQQQSHHQHPSHPFSHHAFNPLQQNGGPNPASSAAGNTIFGSQGVAANGYGASSVAAAAAAAQMGFAHGALGLQHDVAMRGQQQLQHQQLRIREVWANNLEEEMATLRALVERYPFISMVGCRAVLGRGADWSRILNSPESSRGPLPMISDQRLHTTTKPCDATSTC
jgi:CCR4-NOT transcription complex subunit 7/8